MNVPRYLIVPILAVAILSCQQNKAPGSIDTAAENADTTVLDNTKVADTTAIEMPGDKPVPLAQLIVPGISVGQTAINESSEVVHKKLGKPDAGDAAMGKSVSIWYANHDTTGYVTQMYFSRDMGNDETSRVKQIRVTSPWFKVSNKIYAGVPFKIVESVYKLKKIATFEDKGSKRSLYDDVKGGIGFEVDDKDTITGIVIHETGREATGTYLAFFPNLKPIK
jgi:hypothetical protein